MHPEPPNGGGAPERYNKRRRGSLLGRKATLNENIAFGQIWWHPRSPRNRADEFGRADANPADRRTREQHQGRRTDRNYRKRLLPNEFFFLHLTHISRPVFVALSLSLSLPQTHRRAQVPAATYPGRTLLNLQRCWRTNQLPSPLSCYESTRIVVVISIIGVDNNGHPIR